MPSRRGVGSLQATSAASTLTYTSDSDITSQGAVFLEAFATMPWHVMIRFGKWDDIIAEPIQTDATVYPGCTSTSTSLPHRYLV